MFIPGTKIAVIYSSVDKKTGPRSGSIGFIGKQIECVQPTTIDNDFRFLTYLFRIHFIRYGFEQTLRSETKLVYVVFPAPSDYLTKKKQLAVVDHISKRIKNEKGHLLNKLYTQSPYIKQNRDIVLCAPTFPAYACNIINTSNEEKEAWISSILSNLDMGGFIGKMKKPHPSIPPSTINQLYETEINKKYRLQFIKEAFINASPEHARELIKHILILLLTNRSLEKKYVYKRLITSHDSNIISDFSQDINIIENDIIEYLFYPYFEDIIDKLKISQFGGTEMGNFILNTIESVQLIKKRLLN